MTLPRAKLKPELQLRDHDLKQFLKFVTEGEQGKVKAMLDANKNLALGSGDVTDLSKREFKSITGFQYAVWALDWHMWTMIREYLPDEQTKLQCEEMHTGSWVNQHGIHANWNNLITALETYIDHYDIWTGDQCRRHWVQEVGGAQTLLPAHVVNEYCHPSRSFDPCPDYLTAYSLPRSRRIEIYDGGLFKGCSDWFVSSLPNQQLGKTFAFYRGARVGGEYVVRGIATWCMRIAKLVSMLDRAGVSALYSARVRQRNDLMIKFKLKNGPSLISKEFCGS